MMNLLLALIATAITSLILLLIIIIAAFVFNGLYREAVVFSGGLVSVGILYIRSTIQIIEREAK